MNTDKKELRQQIEADIRSTTPKMKKRNFSADAFYRISKTNGEKIHIHTLTTLLNKKTKVEAIAEIERVFAETAAELNVSIDELIIDGKPDFVGISCRRDETDEEYDKRISYLIQNKIYELKRKHEDAIHHERLRSEAIAKLEAELVELKSRKI